MDASNPSINIKIEVNKKEEKRSGFAENFERSHNHCHSHDQYNHADGQDDVEGENEDLDPNVYTPLHGEDSLINRDQEEYEHLKAIAAAFYNYQTDSLKDVNRMERDFKTLSEKQKSYLKFNYAERVDKLKTLIMKNYLFLLKIVQPYAYMFKFNRNEKNEIFMEALNVEMKNVIKMRSTLKLFIRDWAKEGEYERNTCYKPMLEELCRYFPKITKDEEVKVLIPGVGLGRLLYECAKLGFTAQGNEFSYFMLLSSNFMLNNTTRKEEFSIFPLIHTYSNIFWEKAPIKEFKIPDAIAEEDFKDLEGGCRMSMVAGEFVEVYGEKPDQWDSILTCFFLDTANNVIEYIETIHKILKKGGVWINFGPLLYHYSEMMNECSIELSWEEVKNIIEKIGFEFKNEEMRECLYSSDQDSMMKTVYRCVFFTVIKR